MSRRAPSGRLVMIGFPRVSGDEPEILRENYANAEFSPRERG